MARRALDGVMALLLALLFVAGALGPLAGAASPEGRASGRAADNEPNGDWNGAVTIADGEVVEGSLLVTSSQDTQDWYKISVPYGKVVNASLFMVDYNDSNTGQYNFHLDIRSSQDDSQNSSRSQNRWDDCIALQHWGRPSATVAIRVQINYTSDPYRVRTDAGRYAVSISISDPKPYASGTASVFLDGGKGPVNGAIYLWSTIPSDTQLYRARLKCPGSGVAALRVYSVWGLNGNRYLHNFSAVDQTGYTQDVHFGGFNDTACYVFVHGMRGNGTFQLTVEYTAPALDSDNLQSKATLVNDLAARTAFVDQGVDWIDWYKVSAKAGVPIEEAYIKLDGGNYQQGSTFYLDVWDENMGAIGQTYDFPYRVGQTTYDYRIISNITVAYNGPVYFSVRAISAWVWGGGESVADGWYFLSFKLHNDKPVSTGGIPELHMQEDTIDTSLVLSKYAMDPDNDTINYTLFGSGYKTNPRVDKATGNVTFAPSRDWFGTEKVRFHATDSGPGNEWVELNITVVVEPVNDMPYATGILQDLSVLEENAITTADVSTIYNDVDDWLENRTYSMKVLSKETHPANQSLSISYDAKTHAFKLGPAMGFFGKYALEVSCTDGKPDTVPASLGFNLTINHRNHDPVLKPGVSDPTALVMTEHETNSQLVISDFFTDPDLPADYANDSLKYTLTGAHRLEVNVSSDGRITIGTGSEQYPPGPNYEETLKLSAKDLMGRTVAFNLTVSVVPQNDLPEITSILPEKEEVRITEGKKEMFRVMAGDPDTPELSYKWLLDTVLQPKETGSVFNYQTDFTMAGPHMLKVIVSDGSTNISAEWNITVVDFNRAPAGQIITPVNMTKFVKGTPAMFTATGSDPDEADVLTYIWRDDQGNELGRSQNVTSTTLLPGTRIITLEISDGKGGTATYQVTVVVSKPSTTPPSGGIIPGFELMGLVAAAGLGLALAGARRIGGRKR